MLFVLIALAINVTTVIVAHYFGITAAILLAASFAAISLTSLRCWPNLKACHLNKMVSFNLFRRHKKKLDDIEHLRMAIDHECKTRKEGEAKIRSTSIRQQEVLFGLLDRLIDTIDRIETRSKADARANTNQITALAQSHFDLEANIEEIRQVLRDGESSARFEMESTN